MITVTGGNGFLGRHVVRELARRASGMDVYAPTSRECDLRTESGIRELVSHIYRGDTVVHLAARVGGIGANVEHPGLFFYENALMGLRLMEAVRYAGAGKFVSVGTACEYPAKAIQPLTEVDLWKGYPAHETAPYALAKKLLLVQGQAYRDEYGFNAIHVIPTNLYGPGDSFNPETSHVVPALIRKVVHAAVTGRGPVQLWGTGTATRDLLYVEDAARGIADVVESYDLGDPVNLGSGDEVSIRGLAELIAELVGYEGMFTLDTSKPDGAPRRRLHTGRAQEALGFKAQVPLEEGLRRTIEWYLNRP